jgi:hypothetical protein
MKNTFLYAARAGYMVLVLGIPFSILTYRYANMQVLLPSTYVPFAAILTAVFFAASAWISYGYVQVGKRHHAKFLTILSCINFVVSLLAILTVFMYFNQSLFLDAGPRWFLPIPSLEPLLLGIALVLLREKLGIFAFWAGILNICLSLLGIFPLFVGWKGLTLLVLGIGISSAALWCQIQVLLNEAKK